MEQILRSSKNEESIKYKNELGSENNKVLRYCNININASTPMLCLGMHTTYLDIIYTSHTKCFLVPPKRNSKKMKLTKHNLITVILKQ